MTPVRCSAFLAVALTCLGLTACGGNAPVALPQTGATLEGTVTYGSEELQFAQITVSGGGAVVTGVIGEDGRYKVENVPVGEVTIGVNPKAAMSQFQTAQMQGGAYKGLDGKGRGRTTVKFVDVPEKFYDPQSSGIKTNVSAGTNKFDITVPKGK
jgi:hypothetical protein